MKDETQYLALQIIGTHPISELVAAVPVGDGGAAIEHVVAGYEVGELRVARNRRVHVEDLRQRVLTELMDKKVDLCNIIF